MEGKKNANSILVRNSDVEKTGGSYRDGCPEKIIKTSRKDRIRNVTIRQQIGLEETIIKRLNRTSSHGMAMFEEWQKEDCPK